MSNDSSPKTIQMVSISCITYNHANYIRETLDGFLNQKTDFPIEILIHDDASTDGTTEIIQEYEQKYPEIIKPIYETSNQWNLGRRGSAEFNFPRALGNYIALCEGDDYWTDPNKLQTQVDYLEKNPSYSGVVHQSLKMSEDENNKSEVFSRSVPSKIELRDLLDSRKFHTASILFRAPIVKNIQIPRSILSIDRALFLLIASFGPIKYLDKTMCVYRKNAGGISTKVNTAMLKGDLEMVPWLCSIIPSFPKYHYLSFIHRTIFTYPLEISLNDLIQHYALYLIYSFSYFPGNIKPAVSLTIKYLPKRILRAMRRISLSTSEVGG